MSNRKCDRKIILWQNLKTKKKDDGHIAQEDLVYMKSTFRCAIDPVHLANNILVDTIVEGYIVEWSHYVKYSNRIW